MMSGNEERPTPAIIQALLNVGVRQAGIARMFGVSRQAIFDTCKRYGLYRQTRQELLDEFWPWDVPAGMTNQSPYKRLRDHGEYTLTNGKGVDGKGMTEDVLSRLRSFYRDLRVNNLIIEFDPSIPPQPGFANRGGFIYRKRRKSDNDLLIRVNEYTKDLPEERMRVWKFPSREP